jgi:hypothetical protein
MERTFTLKEATLLLPTLEPLLRSAMDSNRKFRQAEQELQRVGHHVFLAGGTLLKISDMLALKERRELNGERLREALSEIQETGVLVKDLDTGLLDFPCQVDDQIILLCWKLGEPAIAYWHTVDEGFKGRKPIDERIARSRHKPG